ncbi:hypothetical protein Zm00014a_011366 [Zea mays]|uniref:DUF985 domain-containing protein n=1 Tax=Zea mays TaxID=4577 RepID=A0A317YI73_MAIZE|nr:hypothetical protein Zm00014a_011366 [Zea mays]
MGCHSNRHREVGTRPQFGASPRIRTLGGSTCDQWPCHCAVTHKVNRAVSTAIYFLLPAGSVSRLHRIPCAETWHFYKGEPLTVFELHDDGHIDLTVIGPHLEAGQRPQYTVPPNVWFGSFPTLDVESFASDGSVLVKSRKRDPELHYSLVGCTCAPGFQYEDFEMAKFEDVRSIAPKAEPFLKFLIPSTD